jgi:hypothetical protein
LGKSRKFFLYSETQHNKVQKHSLNGLNNIKEINMKKRTLVFGDIHGSVKNYGRKT